MRRRLLPSLLFALVMMTGASRVVAQEGVAAGKGDLAPAGPWMAPSVIGDLPRLAILPAAVIAPAAGPHPASSPADLGEALRYNLQRIELDPAGSYGPDVFWAQSGDIRWDVAGAFALTTVVGFTAWNWQPADFRFQSEGWFGEDTKYLGMDKLGHAFSGYLLSEYFTQRIAHSAADRRGAALTGALLGMGVQGYVEVLDGFSGQHGFSYEDLVMDGVGAGFSYLRSTIPGLADTVDFRMEYLPSGHGDGFSPVTDYSGQKYLLAFKLSGLDAFDDSPLRFMELQVGYFARGMSDEERDRGASLRREPYVAIGFNLGELLDETGATQGVPGLAARRAAEYLQVPYTYLANRQD